MNLTVANYSAKMKTYRSFENNRQHRIEIVPEMRSRFFVRLYKNDADILTYVREFLCKMAEKAQSYSVQSRKAVFVRCCQ